MKKSKAKSIPNSNKLCRQEHLDQFRKELKVLFDRWGIEDYLMITECEKAISHYGSSTDVFKVKGMALALNEIVARKTRFAEGGNE